MHIFDSQTCIPLRARGAKSLKVRGAKIFESQRCKIFWMPEVHIFESQMCISFRARGAYLWEPKVSCASFSLIFCQDCWVTSIHYESNAFWYAWFFPSFLQKRLWKVPTYYLRSEQKSCWSCCWLLVTATNFEWDIVTRNWHGHLIYGDLFSLSLIYCYDSLLGWLLHWHHHYFVVTTGRER